MVFTFCVILTLGSCRLSKDQNSNQSFQEAKPGIVQFPDSANAASLITTVDDDLLFEQISKIDIEIQMKKTDPFKSRDVALQAYKKYLASEVSTWTETEKESMISIFEDAKRLCDTISPRIFPGGLKLIKIKTNHYGPDVYYTRGNIIFVPENIFPYESGNLLNVMLHEIFHVLSRQNPNLRHELYRLIGFQKADKPVRLNSMLTDKLLSNPDGVSYQYVIDLDSIRAIPLITSKFLKFETKNPSFFHYLNFDLYGIIDQGSHYEATTDAHGGTTISLKKTPVFFTKIKDNTQYIIHPEEIMADNFMFAVQAYSNQDYKRFSADGKVLINELTAILKKF